MVDITQNLMVYLVYNQHTGLLKTNLLKFLYLVDLEYYKKVGEQATNFAYFYYKRGPWTPQFDQTLSKMVGFEIISLKKEKLEREGEYTLFYRGPKPRFQPTLPPDLKQIVDRLLFIFEESPQKDLLQYVYSIEPMKSTKFGERIDFSKISPQSRVDPSIEKTVLEANKEYESTNFEKMLSSWVEAIGASVHPASPTVMYKLAPTRLWNFRSCPAFQRNSGTEPPEKKRISISDEVLLDRENA
jgi:hypothetical protein